MPSGVVGTLRVNLVGNSAAFSADMKKARDSIKGFAEDSKADLRKYQNDAAKLFRETRTDAERYTASLDRLKALHARGLDDSTFARASSKLRQEFSSQIPLMQRWQDKARSLFTKQGTEDMPLLKAIGANWKSLAGTAAVAGGFVAIGAGAAYAAGEIAEIKERFDELLAVGKQARMLGADVRQFVALQHAAVMTEVSPESLAGGMARMERNVAEAAGNPTGAPAMPFKAIGLDARELIKQDPIEQLIHIARGLESIQTQGERASLAIQLFGRGGYELLPMLNKGEAGIRAFIVEAEKMGLVPSKLGLDKIREANLAWKHLAETWKGGATGDVEALAGLWGSVAKSLESATLWARGFVKELLSIDFGAKVKRSFDWIRDVFPQLKPLVDAIRAVKSGLELLSAGQTIAPQIELSDEAKARQKQFGGKGLTAGSPESPISQATIEAKAAVDIELARQQGILDNMRQFGTTNAALAEKLRDALAVDPTGEKAKQLQAIADQIKNLAKQESAVEKISDLREKLRINDREWQMQTQITPPPGTDRYLASPNPAGMAEKGNLDLWQRPRVKNDDGSVSTVRSMSFEEDGLEVLIPTVRAGLERIMSDDEAIDWYRQSGQHLGKFSTPEQATAYGESLHKQQEDVYTKGKYTTISKAEKTPTVDALRQAFKEAGPAHDRSGLRERQDLLRQAEVKDTRDRLGGMFEQSLGPATKLHQKLNDIQVGLKIGVFGKGPEAEQLAARAAEDAKRSILGARPEEDYRRSVQDLEELRPSLGEEEYKKRKKKLRRGAFEGMEADDIRNRTVQAAPAMLAGSREAYSAIAQSVMNDPKIQLHRETNSKLDRIESAIRDGNAREPMTVEEVN